MMQSLAEAFPTYGGEPDLDASMTGQVRLIVAHELMVAGYWRAIAAMENAFVPRRQAMRNAKVCIRNARTWRQRLRVAS